ncbi:MAG: ATPase, T2SS/T4P/T4SS family [Elusimicrobiota bacterium]
MAENQVFVVSGPKEGCGKSTFAVNFATSYALSSKKNVVILDCDMDARAEIAYYLQTTSFETVQNLWNLASKVRLDNIDPGLFKGRIPFDKHGVGVLSLAANAEEVKKVEITHILKTIAIFSRLYTFVIDVEDAAGELMVPLFDRADYVFWCILPQTVHLFNTEKRFNEFRSLNFNMEKFGVILNQSDLPEALSLRRINTVLGGFNKSILDSIPQEKAVLHTVNARDIVVIEQPHTKFAKTVRSLCENFMNKQQSSAGARETGMWSNILAQIKEPEAAKVEVHGTTAQDKESNIKEKEEKRLGIKTRVHKQMIEELNSRRIDLSAAERDPKKAKELRNIVEESASRILSSIGTAGFTRQENQVIIQEILDDALGLGPLEDILSDKNITEIMVNKKDQIYIEQKGKLTISDKKFISDEQIIQVIRRIIAPLGRRIDESVPLVDARLKDGSRVNAIIPPLSVQGPMITIRRFPEKPLTAEQLIEYGAITPDIVEFLRACVITEKSIIVSGGTGSGKTTFLNMLSGYIPDGERILTVEDVAELRLQKEHIGRLESRPPNIEGKGEVTIRDLVKNTLRMRPDRIVVGECRGGEALDMLQAMNTGHEGSMTTIHANTPKDMVGRLEAMVLMAADLPVQVIRGYIASAVNIIVQISRMQDGSRKLVALTEIVGRDDNGDIKLQDIFLYKRTGVDKNGKVLGTHEPTGNIPKCFDEFKLRGIDLNVDIFKKKS